MNAIPTYLPTYSSLEKEKVGDDDADLTLVIPCGGGGGIYPIREDLKMAVRSREEWGNGRDGGFWGVGMMSRLSLW